MCFSTTAPVSFAYIHQDWTKDVTSWNFKLPNTHLRWQRLMKVFCSCSVSGLQGLHTEQQPQDLCLKHSVLIKGERGGGGKGHHEEAVSCAYCDSLRLCICGLCTTRAETWTQTAKQGQWGLMTGGHGGPVFSCVFCIWWAKQGPRNPPEQILCYMFMCDDDCRNKRIVTEQKQKCASIRKPSFVSQYFNTIKISVIYT